MAHVASTLAKLRERNRREVTPFAEIISLQNQSSKVTAAVRVEVEQLAFINEKLKEENQSLKSKLGDGSSGSNPADSEAVFALEKKLFAVQEELTVLHRRRGENAQQIIDQAALLKENEKTIKDLQLDLEKCQLQLEVSQGEIVHLQSKISELEATNQLLKDEYTTLQLSLSSSERKLVEAQKENDQLVAQIMEFKEKDVARLNQENDMAMKLQQERIRQQLAEAVLEAKGGGGGAPQYAEKESRLNPVPLGREVMESMTCLAVQVPTRNFLKFQAHEGEIHAIKWSPRGLTVATGGSDRKIKLWDISKNVNELRGQLTGSNGGILALDFDSAGSLLLAASSDFASRVWTLGDGRLRHTLTGKILTSLKLGIGE